MLKRRGGPTEMDCKSALAAWGIRDAAVTQIYRSAWDVDDTYILKKNTNPAQLDRSILLSGRLASGGLPAARYIPTADGKPYLAAHDGDYALMEKLKGAHLDPFSGDCRQNGVLLGGIVARLHEALAGIPIEPGIVEADFTRELDTWIIPELQEKQLASRLDAGVLEVCRQAAETCGTLPRQIIHRDMHVGNLLFDGGRFSGYLDFDLSQRNARVFDLCYMGCSLLVESYRDAGRLGQWQAVFRGMLEGYQAVQPLEAAELGVLPRLFVFDEVLFAAFFSLQNQPRLAQDCVDMTNWLHRSIDSVLNG